MLEWFIKNKEVNGKMVWVNKQKYEELLARLQIAESKVLELNSNSTRNKAEKANQVLNNLGIASHTESGKQIRSALALELLGAEYDMVDKYSKAVFVKTQGVPVMKEVRQMLENEGILSTKQGIQHKEEIK